MPRYTLSVNGATELVDVPADMPLLWVIRDIVGLTGTKFGCGIGQCRACTVHVDGVPTPSCQLRAAAADGKAVTTIEGLGAAVAHPLQAAWVAEQVPQCGYCQSGQLMGAAALLEANADPTPTEIDAAMRGHLCRCGSYNRIRRAIQRAARTR